MCKLKLHCVCVCVRESVSALGVLQNTPVKTSVIQEAQILELKAVSSGWIDISLEDALEQGRVGVKARLEACSVLE